MSDRNTGNPKDAGTARDPLIQDARRRPKPSDFVRVWNLEIVPKPSKETTK